MRIPAFAIALACAFFTVPVTAADKPDSEQASSQKTDEGQASSDAANDKNRKICRMEVATGSVMPKRVCRTLAEIEAQQAQAQATKEAMRH